MVTLKYRVEEDGYFHVDVNNSGKYGVLFGAYSIMRKAFKSSIKLKRVAYKNKSKGFYVTGIFKDKPYRSGIYKTSAYAVRHGYKLTYNKDGNTKRRNGLHDWRVHEVK